MRELVAITGATGTGKSTLLRKLVAHHSRVIAIDPVRDDAWIEAGFVRFDGSGDTLNQTLAAMAKCWRRGFRLVYTAAAHGSYPRALEVISYALFQYAAEDGVRPVSLVVDEMADCYSTAIAARAGLNWFSKLIREGRHIDASIYGATQRPQEIATLFRDNAERSFFFRLHSATGRKAVLDAIGQEHARAFMSLKRFEYLSVEGGVVRRSKISA